MSESVRVFCMKTLELVDVRRPSGEDESSLRGRGVQWLDVVSVQEYRALTFSPLLDESPYSDRQVTCPACQRTVRVCLLPAGPFLPREARHGAQCSLAWLLVSGVGLVAAYLACRLGDPFVVWGGVGFTIALMGLLLSAGFLIYALAGRCRVRVGVRTSEVSPTDELRAGHVGVVVGPRGVLYGDLVSAAGPFPWRFLD